MLSKDDAVRFRRSNGDWSNGQIKEIKGEVAIVQWSPHEKKIGTKIVHTQYVQKLKTPPKTLNIYLCKIIFLFTLFVFVLIIDNYFQLKEVFYLKHI